MSTIVITKPGSEERRSVSLAAGEYTIGRAEHNAIVLAGDRVSREHARLLHDGSDVFLLDLGSENGTLLNHIPLRAHERYILRSNDLLIIDGYHLRFSRTDELEQSFNEITESDIVEVKLLKQVLRALESESRPSLQVLNGNAEGKTLVIESDVEEIIVGRDPGCDFPIEEYVISRRHARLRREATGFIVEDCESKNGTYVNNRRVTATPVHDGDRIAFGTIVCMFRQPDEVSVDDVRAEVQQTRQAQRERAAARQRVRAAATAAENAENDADEGTAVAEEASVPPELPESAATTHAYPPPRPRRSIWQRLSPVEISLLWGGVVVLITTVVLLLNLLL